MSQPGAPISPGTGPNDVARNAVNVPSILLMVIGGMGILYGLSGLVQAATAGEGSPQVSLPPDVGNEQMAQLFEKAQALSQGPMAYVFPLILLCTSALVIFGGLKMRALQSYGLAMAAAIVSMIPCFGPCGVCFCVALPVGIWAIVVLNKPEVKSAFQG